jgi:cell wall-associated NlpC family hydrolase
MLRPLDRPRRNSSGRPRRPRRRLHLVAVAALVAATAVPVTGASSAAAAPRDDLEAKRAEARAIQAEVGANGERISILDEQYNAARLKIEEAARGIAEAERRLGQAAARTERISRQLRGRAAALYVQASGSSPLQMFDASDVHDLGARTKYTAAAAEQDDLLLEQLEASRQVLDERRAALEHQRQSAEAEQDALDARREELVAAQQRQERLLAGVEDDIARLVREEEARQAREELARARAEALRRQQEQAALDAAARDAPSGDPGGPTVTDPDTGTPVDVPAPNPNAQTAVETARAQLGKPYVYAAAGPDAFDCSGLTMYAWAAAGVSLPHSSQAQYASLPHVAQSQLQPGDLVFFGSPIHHVGIYAGGGTMIEAPHTGAVVRYRSIYRDDYVGGARPG